jgi:predicted RNase H-like HicB family nuclease
VEQNGAAPQGGTTMKLKAVFYPEKEGGYSASVPALPGCHSQGETLEEALANIREAAEGWLEAGNELADEKGAAVKDVEL